MQVDVPHREVHGSIEKVCAESVFAGGVHGGGLHCQRGSRAEHRVPARLLTYENEGLRCRRRAWS